MFLTETVANRSLQLPPQAVTVKQSPLLLLQATDAGQTCQWLL
jgi:hypothetical protein